MAPFTDLSVLALPEIQRGRFVVLERLKLKAPGLGSYVQYPFDSSWHTEQRIGTYNGGYWRGVASLQLNYEATFAFCS